MNVIPSVSTDLLRQVELAVLACVSTDSVCQKSGYEYIEQLKLNPLYSIHIGFDLIEYSNEGLVKHFGLQCIEESIKYKWTSFDSTQKVNIKERLWQLMLRLEQPPQHLKAALVRCVCEIAKREWPQQWPSLLNELQQLSSKPEYVLLILAYLVEDVIVLQTLTSQRKRDIQTTLLEQSVNLIEFFNNFIPPSSVLYSSELIQNALYALTMFATFVPVEKFFTSSNIVQKVTNLLSDSSYRMKAAEYLSVLANRRGKQDERQPLLHLFTYLLQNGTTFNDILKLKIPISTDNYDYMKQYTVVIGALCEQLCYVCGNNTDKTTIPLPTEFTNGSFLNVVLSIIQHPSLYVSSYGYQMWLQLIKSTIFNNDKSKLLESIMPILLRSICHSLVRCPLNDEQKQMNGDNGAPVDSDSASLERTTRIHYLHHDFEDEADYQKFFAKYRTLLIRSVNSICCLNDYLSVTIRIGFDYIDYCLKTATNDIPSFEALTLYWQILEKHLRSLIIIEKENSPVQFNTNPKLLSNEDEHVFCERGQNLIRQLLTVNDNNSNIEIYSYSLRLITCLYPFTCGEKQFTQHILEHLFRSITTERQTLKITPNPVQKQSGCFIDLCLNYGHYIFCYFNDLFKVTNELVQQANQNQQLRLSGWQWSTLVECLTILLNHFNNYQQQSILISQLVQPFTEFLSAFNNTVHDVQAFVNYIGFDSMRIAAVSNTQRFLFLSVHILCAILRRIQLPNEKSNVGYQITIKDELFTLNPASPCYIRLVPILFKFLVLCHSLHAQNSPLNQSKLIFLTTMTDAEKAVYLKQDALDLDDDVSSTTTMLTTTPKLQAEDRRLHNRFSSFMDRCQILVGCCFSLKPELYELENANLLIMNTLFSYMDILPDFRLRNLIRSCFLPLVRQCPKIHMTTILMPVLETLCPFMRQILTEKWKLIMNRQSGSSLGEDNTTHDNGDQTQATQNKCEEEVIEEQVICFLTRDYIDILKTFLSRNSVSNNIAVQSVDEISDEMIGDNGDGSNLESQSMLQTQTTNHRISVKFSISEFGLDILQHSPDVCQSCLLILFDGLSWPDTSSVNRMLSMCHTLIQHLPKLIGDNSDGFLRDLFIRVLSSLKTHGDNEPIACSILTLAILMYETLYQQKLSTTLYDNVLLEIPTIKIEQVNGYRDKMIVNLSQMNKQIKTLNEKQKRDMLKHIVQPIMGKNVGQMFKKEPLALTNLPQLLRFSKRCAPIVNQTKLNEEDHGLLQLFSNP
ncbi:unnamed protein product [Didymodactylos carnosus]|uniref:Exportin-5 n=1 Tax=Didymodactylos carnosus TaxID=1234261 RepID=A0A813XV50_9BILA|nr:unnamed protein product [Didymodactylos carnosus]CAF0880586.1 unnamed protein product [Didymodactylos carnosus]CAF3657703.1 unnamed protein product [Didymodactylos carnosus]CAF3664301.1 unnamed protein product [Didymodactylos carnosus]